MNRYWMQCNFLYPTSKEKMQEMSGEVVAQLIKWEIDSPGFMTSGKADGGPDSTWEMHLTFVVEAETPGDAIVEQSHILGNLIQLQNLPLDFGFTIRTPHLLGDTP